MALRALDLRHILLEDAGIIAVATKTRAVTIARERGYSLNDIYPAYNRVGRFWVIGQWVQYGTVFRAASHGPQKSVVLTLRSPTTGALSAQEPHHAL